MTQPICIGTSSVPNLLLKRLNHELAHLQREGFPLNIDIDRIGDVTFMGCRLQNRPGISKDTLPIIKTNIADCLADLIIDEWETRIVVKIIRDNYFYYSDEEKQIILQKVREILNPAGFEFYQRCLRKEMVMDRILEYLDLSQELILEGFVNFRLKDYCCDLENIVNSAVDEFLLEKEYQEFIRLLKYFVDIQEPKVNKVKILFKSTGNYAILDEKDTPLHHECLEGLMVDVLENEINYDDLLISAMITLAPRELELHLEEGVPTSDTIRTIQSVFDRRITYCGGCQLCRPKQ